MNFKNHSQYILLTMLIACLSACVVVPKQTASYDPTCKVAVQKFSLATEDISSDRNWSCDDNYCAWDISAELAGMAFTTVSSTLVSGSIALAGNTAYWLESDGECPNEIGPNAAQTPRQTLTPKSPENTEFVIEEEIVSAKL